MIMMTGHRMDMKSAFSTVLLLFFLSTSIMCAEYHFRLPVPSTAKVNEVNGILEIECSFSPTRAFSKQTNKRVDSLHARRIVNNAILMYMNKSGQRIMYHGMTSTQPPNYLDKSHCVFFFSIPKQNIKVDNRSTVPQKKAEFTKQSKQSASSVKTNNIPIQQDRQEILSVTHKPAPAPVQLISENELKNMQFSGYSIRLKQDIQTIIDNFESSFSEIKSGEDFDSLKNLHSFYQNLTRVSQECNRKISEDTHLLQSEITEIQGLLQKRVAIIKNEAKSWGIEQCRAITADAEKELLSIKKDNSETVKNDDIDASIKNYKQTISELKQLENLFMTMQ